MALSRRLRFEILRRDAHSCRYCGATAPDVKLTVDHVIPEALGGGDDPTNLVTACVSCNAGKSSIAPDSPVVEQVSADAERWSTAMKLAAGLQSHSVKQRAEYVAAFDEAWRSWTYPDGRTVSRPPNWESTIGRNHDLGVDRAVLVALVHSVLPRSIRDDQMWRYFCGALRNVVSEQREMATDLLERGIA